jgi:hypothetical protein
VGLSPYPCLLHTMRQIPGVLVRHHLHWTTLYSLRLRSVICHCNLRKLTCAPIPHQHTIDSTPSHSAHVVLLDSTHM